MGGTNPTNSILAFDPSIPSISEWSTNLRMVRNGPLVGHHEGKIVVTGSVDPSDTTSELFDPTNDDGFSSGMDIAQARLNAAGVTVGE